jgi:hypothetical protein
MIMNGIENSFGDSASSHVHTSAEFLLATG